MAEEKETNLEKASKDKNEPNSASDEASLGKCSCGSDCRCTSILGGFKLGFGIFLAFLTGWCIVSLIAIAIYYLAKLF